MDPKILCSVLVLTLFICIHPTSALFCYQCRGDTNNSDCELNVLTSAYQQNCTTGFVCASYIVESSTQYMVNRGCFEPNVCDVVNADSSHVIGVNRTVKLCTTCSSSDLCNAAHPVTYSAMLLVFVPIATFIYNYF
ncbi:prostate stem cell antigen-like isoform X1 [Sitophilus oryzae]|uniref:Prostate stem cell antigen-like isoform X1 n=1 Tax=Sitophilus oryzae TaxID=7048 RepID=A0A6J2Y7V1_SITOR|nr:prostate stem cell antigen-like isoform X1 [Sitophilus oryzae]